MLPGHLPLLPEMRGGRVRTQHFSDRIRLALLFVVILTSLGTWGLPQMVGKFYAIKSEKDIHKGTVISTVFAIIVAGGCYFLGGFGRLYADRVVINEMTGKPLFDTIILRCYRHFRLL